MREGEAKDMAWRRGGKGERKGRGHLWLGERSEAGSQMLNLQGPAQMPHLCSTANPYMAVILRTTKCVFTRGHRDPWLADSWVQGTEDRHTVTIVIKWCLWVFCYFCIMRKSWDLLFTISSCLQNSWNDPALWPYLVAHGVMMLS